MYDKELAYELICNILTSTWGSPKRFYELFNLIV